MGFFRLNIFRFVRVSWLGPMGNTGKVNGKEFAGQAEERTERSTPDRCARRPPPHWKRWGRGHLKETINFPEHPKIIHPQSSFLSLRSCLKQL